MSAPGAIETPSGKSQAGENFPVGSWLLPRKLRPHIAQFYRFARAIDDIADNPELASKTKIERLNAMEDAVCGGERYGQVGFETATLMHDSLLETRITTRHCTDLIEAFCQDAVKNRYEDWEEVISYCMRSAAPVGRYLLDLHGENQSNYLYSDALCNALQIINHLQDCKDDYRELDRVYLPRIWLNEYNAPVETLEGRSLNRPLRLVVNRCLEGTKELMKTAEKLPARLKNRQLATEAAVIVSIANKLIGELEKRDPLAESIVLSKAQLALCTMSGIVRGVLRY